MRAPSLSADNAWDPAILSETGFLLLLAWDGTFDPPQAAYSPVAAVLLGHPKLAEAAALKVAGRKVSNKFTAPRWIESIHAVRCAGSPLPNLLGLGPRRA